MALMDDLGMLGLDGLSTENLYETEQKEEAKPAPAAKPAPEQKKEMSPQDESALLFDKSYTCPVCTRGFTAKTVRTGKVHTIRIEYDLRPVYDKVDQVKYDVIACPHCGYAMLVRYHGSLSDKQGKMIRDSIGAKFRPQTWSADLYTYDEAKIRYQLALANAVSRKAKASEKAYICMKMAWLTRGETEYLKQIPGVPDTKFTENAIAEKNYRGQALDGFAQARQTENFPIAGMDEKTLDYLMASLYLDTGKYQDCARFIGNILISKNISTNLRRKAEDLKMMLTETLKNSDPMKH